MMVFKPKGETAQWRTVYAVLDGSATGRTITYAELADALEMDARKDRHRIQAAARKAADHMLKSADRAVEVIPNEGYRVVSAGRQIALAGQQVERATNSLDRGRDLTTHVRLDELQPQERQIIQTMALGFAQVAEWARQIGRRVEDHEDRLSDIEAELQRLRDQRET